MAARRGRMEAELAIRWCLQHGYVAIPKTKDAKRLELNAPFGFSLSQSEMQDIDALDRGFSISKTTKDLALTWEEVIEDVSEVSEADAAGDAPRPRRRRRRKVKGKGKGKATGKSGHASSGNASRPAEILFRLA